MALSPGARLGPYEIVVRSGPAEWARSTKPATRASIAPSRSRSCRADSRRRSRSAGALRARGPRGRRAGPSPHLRHLRRRRAPTARTSSSCRTSTGQTLAARLEKGPLPLDQALKIAVEIADALDKAHRQGIIHRDLKPANIMLTKSGLEAARLRAGEAARRPAPISMSGMTRLATPAPSTAQGTILGTVQYMAPEQVEGKEADARSDIWALGVVIYEMVTGTRPFKGDTPASVIGCHSQGRAAADSCRASRSCRRHSITSSAGVSPKMRTIAGSRHAT